MKTRSFLLTIVLLNLMLTGCSVAPWERGNLAKPQMALDSHPTQTNFRGHAYGSREGATGSSVGAGGGCGCY
jgi:PBP1b-binding outer membrane lipoprotein LpoB